MGHCPAGVARTDWLARPAARGGGGHARYQSSRRLLARGSRSVGLLAIRSEVMAEMKIEEMAQHPPGEVEADAVWGDACPFPLGGRTAKPREHGVTMVIDKGLGLGAMADLLDAGAAHIDIVKLAFGTSALYSESVLRDKLARLRAAQVLCCPGGTALEVAVVHGKARAFVDRAVELGFTALEVSDGTIEMAADTRRSLLAYGRSMGLSVVSEVGKKHPADQLPGHTLRDQIQQDLESGAWKVIVEGRESGQGVVIYRADGSIDADEMESIASACEPALLIWEAPQKSQQQDLIQRFGSNVNLGNVRSEDVLSLEALRVGLRADTLRTALRAGALAAVRSSAAAEAWCGNVG